MTAGEKRVVAIEMQQPEKLSAETEAYFRKCEEKLGLVPNVLVAYAFDETKLRAFSDFYNDLMLGQSGLSKLEREMIAVVVSSVNHCYYCLTAHGASVRQLSGDPALGEQMVMNYRVADLDERQKAMLDFAVKLTETPDRIEEEDREALRRAGFSDRDIWDVAATAAFFNMSNRMAAATDMRPNDEYHAMARQNTGLKMTERKDKSEEARRDLDRVSQEGGLLNTPKLEAKSGSVRDHLTAADADQGDRIEVWGTRIGRWLSVVVFILLAIWLFDFFKRNQEKP